MDGNAEGLSEAAELTLGLLGISSVSGEEEGIRRILEAIEDYFGREVPTNLVRFDPGEVSKRVEAEREAPDRMYNLRVGELHDPDMVLICNIDTADYNRENWEHGHLGEVGEPPDEYERTSHIWEGTDSERVIYGRGAVGGKSVTAAAMVAVKNAFRRYDNPSVMLLVESDHQRDFRGIKHFMRSYADEGLAPELVVIGASTDCRLGYKHRGLIHQRIELTGEGVHAPRANDPEAVHAAERSYPILAELESFRHDLRDDEELRSAVEKDEYSLEDVPEGVQREITFVTSKITVGSDNNRVPGTFDIHTDSRVPAHFDVERIDRRLRERLHDLEAVEEMEREDSVTFDVICYAKYDAVTNDNDSPAMRSFQSAIRNAAAARGRRNEAFGQFFQPEYFTELALWGQGFEGADISGFSTDDPRVIFGTGPSDKSHEPDEFVQVATIDITTGAFENAIEDLCVR